MATLEHSQSLRPRQVDARLLIPGPHYSMSAVPEPDSRAPDTEPESLETELRVHKIHDTLETGLQRILRSLVVTH